MGFTWKSLFVKEDENENINENNSIEETVEESKPVQSMVTPIGQDSSPVVGTVDNRFIEILSDKLDSLNLPGEDYLELKEALDNLLNVPGMNENTAYISAFMTLKTRGLTVDKCTESIDYYITELNKERDLFNEAQESKVADKVTVIENEIAEINAKNEERNAEILRLTEEIKSSNDVILTKTAEMNENLSAIQADNANFDATLNQFVSALESDKVKVEQYLSNL